MHRMPFLRRRGPPAAWAPGVLAGLPLLAGCSTAPGSSQGPAWGFVTLALLLVAGAAFASGLLLGRQRLAQSLREARDQQRHLIELHDAWLWRTDAQHRLLSWQGPGAPMSRQCTLFTQGLVLQRLQALQAFQGLRVKLAAAQDGSLSWELRARPCHDELGRFDGFIGSARPTDVADAQQSGTAALAAALASHAAPALLAQERSGDGADWRVTHFNPAAGLLWPQIETGLPLAQLPGCLPGPLAAALQSPAPGPLEAEGWQLLPYGPLPDGSRGVLLAQAPAPVAAPTAAAAAEVQSESDSFSFTVSHDLRAPIRVVEGFTRIVKEDYGRLLDRVGNDHLDRVLGAAARMNLMIDALLTLARLSSQPLARQPVNLSQLAGYVIDDLKRGVPEREVDVQIEPGLAAQGDPTLLRLVLENLLGNAWKYSAKAARPQISLRAVAHGSHTAYVVRDNGAGFDMRSADRLFGLFQRLHSASEFPGTGVGLASVRRIVRRHGGEIWAEAEPGRGAAFFFTLG
jgi:signal transduction histidine kinase